MIVNCQIFGEKIFEEVKSFVENLEFRPVLIDILLKDDDSAKAYAKSKKKVGEKIGVEVRIESIFEESFKRVTELLGELSADKEINGIIIERPLPSHITSEVFSHIVWYKDVDGQNPTNLGRVIYGYEELAPSTPKSVVYFLENYLGSLRGKKVCVINRSVSVGKPLAHLLLNRDCTVTICHSKTEKLEEITRTSEIVVVAVGKPYFLNKNMVRENSIVVDVGINVVNGKIVGDVSPEVAEIAHVTQVPGGIGYITSRMIFKNLVEAIKIQKGVLK